MSLLQKYRFSRDKKLVFSWLDEQSTIPVSDQLFPFKRVLVSTLKRKVVVYGYIVDGKVYWEFKTHYKKRDKNKGYCWYYEVYEVPYSLKMKGSYACNFVRSGKYPYSWTK